MQREHHPYSWGDAVAAAIILIVTVLYISLLPHNLSPADESVHLYDAKRLLGGAVMYRDVFNDITPGYMYLIALLFWLFGTTIAVARTAMAVLHGLSAAFIYATCRAFDVRRGLAWPAALAYLVICQSAWPIASQHWLSTLLSVIVLWLCAMHLRDRRRWSFVLGIVLGLFVGVQQQRAAIMVFGVGVWLILDHVVERRYRAALSIRTLITTILWVAVGISLVVVPLLSWVIAEAGFARVWRALVIFPIYDYGGVTHCPWGDVNIVTAWQASFTFPRLLKYLPLAMLPALLRLVSALVRGRDEDEARRLLLLVVTAATSMLSISYFPDFVHIAFIAPVFLVAGAEAVDWAVRAVPMPPRAVRVAGAIAGIALVVASGVRLRHNLVRLWQEFPVSRSTAFGRVDMKTSDVPLYDRMRDLMRDAPSRYLYCYPVIAHLYLMLDVDNPTAHGFFVPGYSGPDLVQEVLDSLTATRPPYIVFLSAFVRPDDPVGTWITTHYEPIDTEGPLARLIFRPRPAQSS